MFSLQGRGSYEDRTEMLRLIVDLVEASIYADNPEWRLRFFIFEVLMIEGNEILCCWLN